MVHDEFAIIKLLLTIIFKILNYRSGIVSDYSFIIKREQKIKKETLVTDRLGKII